MTIQKAAYEILKKSGKPTSSKELARIAIDGRMVTSTALDPIQSHAQTIEKNIRDRTYNNPKLVFIHSSQGRLIALPGWDSDLSAVADDKTPNLSELRVHVPKELMDKIRLADQAKLKNSFDEFVSLLLTEGLSKRSSDIKEGLIKKADIFSSP